MRSSLYEKTFAFCLTLLATGGAGAQLGGVVLEGRIQTQLQGCVSAETLKVGYVHGMAALGMTDTRSVNLTVKLQALPSTDPDSMLIELTASSWGRPLGTRQLRVKASDCAALPRGFGDVIARMAFEATALDMGRRPLLLAPPPFQVQAGPPQSAPELSEHVALGVGAGVAFGMLPSAALGLQLQAATPNYPVSLRLRLGMLLPQGYEVPAGTIRSDSYDLTLEMCPSYRLPQWQRLTLRICFGPRIGIKRAWGQDFNEPTERIARGFLYFGAAPEVVLRIAGSTYLVLGGGSALGVIRPRLLIGVDTERRSIELPGSSTVRHELTASVVGVL